MKAPIKQASSSHYSCFFYLRLICLGLLLIPTASCVFGVVIPTETNRLVELDKAVNDSPYKIVIPDIEQTVPAHKTFRPTQHADVARPPSVNELTRLEVKKLATLSAGMAITLHTRQQKKPLHGYLVVYPVYRDRASPARYRLRITGKDIHQVRQGKTVQLHGHYPYRGSNMVSWVMWLSEKSLDVDCGCD